ncbi:MAG: hypothetical protein N3J91_15740 [Verrucomicrobiae bacterium]|nr:hypothetical protein [Verrucomicrobiae bacterium]
MQQDCFEERLRSQPWRPLPRAWRKEILDTALASAQPQAGSRRWRLMLEYLLWPGPRAWAAVAALWIVALAGNLVQHAYTPVSPPALSLGENRQHETLPQRQRILAEWLNQNEAEPVPPSQLPPSPRGEGRMTTNRVG